MTRPFRFGVQISSPVSGTTWQDTARRIESLGYSSLLMPDHFGDQYAPVPALAVAAEVTGLTVGTLVFDNDYKHPVVLAKEIATLEALTAGRVEFGIGAGWMRTDYEQSGIPYDAPGVRVDRFEESLPIYKGLLAGDTVTAHGTHYQVTSMPGTPAPVRPGGPPLLIGAGGKRMLRLAGQWADIVSINPNMAAGEVTAETAKDAMADEIDQKVAWVREGAGDRFDQIEMSTTLFFAMVTDDAEVARSTADGAGAMFGVTGDDIRATPIVAVGSVDQIADSLRARRERWGFSYMLVPADAFEALAPVVAQLAGT